MSKRTNDFTVLSWATEKRDTALNFAQSCQENIVIVIWMDVTKKTDEDRDFKRSGALRLLKAFWKSIFDSGTYIYKTYA